MTPNFTSYFRELVSRHMGLVIPDKDEESLSKLLASRVKLLKLPSAAAYCAFLDEGRQESEQEWKQLAHHLTIGESYFFRDIGQMMLLEKVVIPELLKRKTGDESLRILSAGCATGEEPYSIAMMIDRMTNEKSIPESPNSQIFGVDINEEALKVGRSGRYSSWSFRGVPQEIQDAYFHRTKIYWQLNHEIRDQVTFLRLNLVKDPLPNDTNDIQNMDLVLCRNVNIYFRKETVARILNKLVHTLSPGGYLVTGHAELQGITHPMLTMRSYPESVIYQRMVDPHTPISVSRISQVPPPTPRSLAELRKRIETPKQDHFIVPILEPPTPAAKPGLVVKETSSTQAPESTHAESELLFRNGHYRKVISQTKLAIEKNLNHLDSWRLMARAHANLGEHLEAEACCDRMIKIDAFYAQAYYLKAHIAMERGDESGTRELLKRTLYLDHTFIAPHLELAEIYAREGNPVLAKKMRQAALQLLRAMPKDEKVEMIDEYTAGELILDIEKML
jgi:chemotaxis protein methyltransferase CheR